MTLRELLKEKGIAYKVVSDALGIHPTICHDMTT